MVKDWLSHELLVQLIEKSIDPNSRVEHNVWLPDLDSNSGKKRQCDIIIRTGKPPRETLTLVEVQKRNRKVELNEFQGWIAKMENVGAQHLICVSTMGFPDSAKEKAKKSGNKIRLVTLKSRDAQTIPINVPPLSFNVNEPLYKILHIPKISLLDKRNAPLGRIHTRDIKFSINTSATLMTLEDVVTHYLNRYKVNKPGQITVTLPIGEDELYLHFSERIERVSFPCQVYVEVKKHKGEVTTYSYEQESDGVLAWIFEGEVRFGGRHLLVKMPVIPKSDGSFDTRYLTVELTLDAFYPIS